LLISPYPATRVAAEAQTRLGAHLASKGFALVASGPSGLTWRRDLEGKVLAALVFLGLMAIGGIGGAVQDGDVGSALVGIVCGVAAIVLLSRRRPATVEVALRPRPLGCEVELRTTETLPDVEALLRTVANASSTSAESDDARSAYLAGRIDVDEFESAIADALHRDS
jgi:hypothetical protein